MYQPIKNRIIIILLLAFSSMFISNRLFAQNEIKPPEFIGGLDSLNKYLLRNIYYSKKDMVEERVVIQFTVKKDSTLADFEIVRGKDPKHINEVLRAVKQSPKWQPATEGGRPIDMPYSIPVNFIRN